jgi:hypothetical protein
MAVGKVNGKNKGNTFERKMANLLSARFKAFLGLETGFRRNSDSGSFFGGANVRRVAHHDLDHAVFGDLMCPKSFKYSIECKHYKTAPSFQSVINKEVTQWDKWLEQATQDSVSANKLLLLIIKYNNVPEFILVKEKLQIDEIMMYKGYYSYTLSDFLKLGDDVFFD